MREIFMSLRYRHPFGPLMAFWMPMAIGVFIQGSIFLASLEYMFWLKLVGIVYIWAYAPFWVTTLILALWGLLQCSREKLLI